MFSEIATLQALFQPARNFWNWSFALNFPLYQDNCQYVPRYQRHSRKCLVDVESMSILGSFLCMYRPLTAQNHEWWCHQMEKFSALLAICAGNSPVTGEFPAQRPVTRSFDVLLWSAWINGWVNNREAGDLRRNLAHYNVTVMEWSVNLAGLLVLLSSNHRTGQHRLFVLAGGLLVNTDGSPKCID